MPVMPGYILANPLWGFIETLMVLFHGIQLCFFSFSLPPGADADSLFRSKYWEDGTTRDCPFVWLIWYLWNWFNLWILVKIGSLIRINWPLWFLMMSKGPIGCIMDGLTVLFKLISPLGNPTPSTEDYCSSLWAIYENYRLQTGLYDHVPIWIFWKLSN